MDTASADAFGAVVRVAGLAVHDGLPRSLLFTRNIGATYSVHTRRAQTLQAFIPNTEEISTCLRERSSELSDACRAAIEAGTKQLPDGIEARERTAR
jgi:hypothetical protein